MGRFTNLQVEPEVSQELKIQTAETSSLGEEYIKWYHFPAKALPCPTQHCSQIYMNVPNQSWQL